MLAEDIPEMDFNFSHIWTSAFANDMEKTVGCNYRKILCVYRGLNLKFYYGQNDSDNFAKNILDLIVKNSKFGKKINSEIRRHSDILKKYSEKITPNFLRKLSAKEFIKILNDLDEIHTTLYTWGWLPNAVDMFHSNFTNFLKAVLDKKLDPDEVNSALVVMTTSPEKSIIQQEHESFLRLVALKQKQASQKVFDHHFNNHLQKYFYLKYLWLGLSGVYDKKYYLSEIAKFIKSGEVAQQLLKKEQKIFQDTLKARVRLIKQLKLSQKEVALFDTYSEFAVTKLYRRDAQIYWSYKMGFVFDEYVRRFNVSIIEARFLRPQEIKQALTQGISNELRKELKTRVNLCVYYIEKGLDEIYYGSDAEKIVKSLEKVSNHQVDELKGQTACLGKVKGRVRVINIFADMKKMQKGDILVSIATNPDIVPAMKKAGAIVTEQGGITSHAAIVSRELGTPCIIGTKIATKVFKDGDLVEVDANKGIVRKLNVKSKR
jgi:phosphohistidine swiveling domain-containing protein/nucleoside diphosphate kinase